MGSTYSISESDLVPDYVQRTTWDALRTDADTGQTASALEIIEPAESLFASECCGLFATAANLALAKPQVMHVVVWQLHNRRASEAALKIPEAITAAKDAALKWARTTGKALLAAEGNVTLPGEGAVEYDAPTARYTRDDMDLL